MLQINSSGFSLINLMMGMAVFSIVGMTAAYISAETQKTGVEGESLYHLNQEHILALQKSKSINLIKTSLGMTTGSPVEQCLSGRGSACHSLAVSNWTSIPVLSQTQVEPSGRTIATVGEYKLECSNPSSCEALVIKVNSSLTLGSDVLYKRQSEVRLGGIVLADRREIDFSCVATTGNLLTAMNMGTLRGECLPLPASSPCPAGKALTAYHIGAAPGCQPNTTLNCPTGFRSVGILSGQGGCI